MADLDDFFAKKDRKKSKGKKFATADEIAKKLEETGKRSEKLKREKLQSQLSGHELDEQGNAILEEDEWKDFEEEKKDYSGLKIQNLTISENDDGLDGASGPEDEDGGMEENEAGEMVPRRKHQGPWRVVQQQNSGSTESNDTEEPTVVNKPVEKTTPVHTGGSYIPPARRAGAMSSSSLMSSSTPHNARLRAAETPAAPDVRNEELFPSLSAAATTETARKKKEEANAGFEEVKTKSYGRYEPPAMRAQSHRVAIGNKFGALNSEQS